jgi:hypothetical protein
MIIQSMDLTFKNFGFRRGLTGRPITYSDNSYTLTTDLDEICIVRCHMLHSVANEILNHLPGTIIKNRTKHKNKAISTFTIGNSLADNLGTIPC